MTHQPHTETAPLRALLTKAAIILLTVGVITAVMPRDSRFQFYPKKGEVWKYADVVAPFEFPVYKSDETVKQEKDSLTRIYEPYFVVNSSVAAAQIRRLCADDNKLAEHLPADFVPLLANRLHDLYAQGILSSAEYARFNTDTARTIRVVDGKVSRAVPLREVLSTKKAYERLLADADLAEYRLALQKAGVVEYIQPNLIFDGERSTQSLNDLLSLVPTACGWIMKNQKIISRGEIVTEDLYLALNSLKRETERHSTQVAGVEYTVMGEALYVLVLILCFTLYLTLFRPDYFDKPRTMLMPYLLIGLFAILTSLVSRGAVGYIYVVPYAIVPIFVRVFMDSRTAFITHFTTVMVSAMMLQHPFDFLIVELTAGMVVIQSLRELQYRAQIFKTALIVTLAQMAMLLSYDLISVKNIAEIDTSNYNHLAAGGVLLLFAYPMLYLFEKTFGFISDITLIELSNTNSPLLRRLSEVAPGTFQHSIMVSNLASDIAAKIGADSQLVRTGALYHDIGKMANPIYFTENQSVFNPHTTLSAVESAQMIISHVTEGLKLAEKSDLPPKIRHFISTHHGQGKAKYFYIKYKNEHPGEEVDELMFTYPGPNPFTREQAILMMADTVEAASRSLADYSEKSIRELVTRLVDGQVADGYFRECPITFRDIEYAKTVMIEKLKTIYHTRISYPKEKKS